MTLSSSVHSPASELSRNADTSVPILDVLASRWSPRSFDGSAVIDEDVLTGVLEAARWTPSANNVQPWRFIVGRRGSETFEKIAAGVMGFNRAWVGAASVLIVNVAEVSDDAGAPRPFASYDLGQAVAHLSVQAHHSGLHVHQMGGVEREALHAAFGLDDRFEVQTVSAIGVVASPDALADESARAREIAPRGRKALEEIVLLSA